MSAKPVALLRKLRVQQGEERVVRAEEHSQVCQALGLSFWAGNCCFKVSLSTGVRMFESLRLHRKVTASVPEGLVLATLLSSALE